MLYHKSAAHDWVQFSERSHSKADATHTDGAPASPPPREGRGRERGHDSKSFASPLPASSEKERVRKGVRGGQTGRSSHSPSQAPSESTSGSTRSSPASSGKKKGRRQRMSSLISLSTLKMKAHRRSVFQQNLTQAKDVRRSRQRAFRNSSLLLTAWSSDAPAHAHAHAHSHSHSHPHHAHAHAHPRHQPHHLFSYGLAADADAPVSPSSASLLTPSSPRSPGHTPTHTRPHAHAHEHESYTRTGSTRSPKKRLSISLKGDRVHITPVGEGGHEEEAMQVHADTLLSTMRKVER